MDRVHEDEDDLMVGNGDISDEGDDELSDESVSVDGKEQHQRYSYESDQW